MPDYHRVSRVQKCKTIGASRFSKIPFDGKELFKKPQCQAAQGELLDEVGAFLERIHRGPRFVVANAIR